MADPLIERTRYGIKEFSSLLGQLNRNLRDAVNELNVRRIMPSMPPGFSGMGGGIATAGWIRTPEEYIRTLQEYQIRFSLGKTRTNLFMTFPVEVLGDMGEYIRERMGDLALHIESLFPGRQLLISQIRDLRMFFTEFAREIRDASVRSGIPNRLAGYFMPVREVLRTKYLPPEVRKYYGIEGLEETPARQLLNTFIEKYIPSEVVGDERLRTALGIYGAVRALGDDNLEEMVSRNMLGIYRTYQELVDIQNKLTDKGLSEKERSTLQIELHSKIRRLSHYKGPQAWEEIITPKGIEEVTNWVRDFIHRVQQEGAKLSGTPEEFANTEQAFLSGIQSFVKKLTKPLPEEEELSNLEKDIISALQSTLSVPMSIPEEVMGLLRRAVEADIPIKSTVEKDNKIVSELINHLYKHFNLREEDVEKVINRQLKFQLRHKIETTGTIDDILKYFAESERVGIASEMKERMNAGESLQDVLEDILERELSNIDLEERKQAFQDLGLYIKQAISSLSDSGGDFIKFLDQTEKELFEVKESLEETYKALREARSTLKSIQERTKPTGDEPEKKAPGKEEMAQQKKIGELLKKSSELYEKFMSLQMQRLALSSSGLRLFYLTREKGLHFSEHVPPDDAEAKKGAEEMKRILEGREEARKAREDILNRIIEDFKKDYAGIFEQAEKISNLGIEPIIGTEEYSTISFVRAFKVLESQFKDPNFINGIIGKDILEADASTARQIRIQLIRAIESYLKATLSVAEGGLNVGAEALNIGEKAAQKAITTAVFKSGGKFGSTWRRLFDFLFSSQHANNPLRRVADSLVSPEEAIKFTGEKLVGGFLRDMFSSIYTYGRLGAGTILGEGLRDRFEFLFPMETLMGGRFGIYSQVGMGEVFGRTFRRDLGNMLRTGRVTLEGLIRPTDVMTRIAGIGGYEFSEFVREITAPMWMVSRATGFLGRETDVATTVASLSRVFQQPGVWNRAFTVMAHVMGNRDLKRAFGTDELLQSFNTFVDLIRSGSGAGISEGTLSNLARFITLSGDWGIGAGVRGYMGVATAATISQQLQSSSSRLIHPMTAYIASNISRQMGTPLGFQELIAIQSQIERGGLFSEINVGGEKFSVAEGMLNFLNNISSNSDVQAVVLTKLFNISVDRSKEFLKLLDKYVKASGEEKAAAAAELNTLINEAGKSAGERFAEALAKRQESLMDITDEVVLPILGLLRGYPQLVSGVANILTLKPLQGIKDIWGGLSTMGGRGLVLAGTYVGSQILGESVGGILGEFGGKFLSNQFANFKTGFASGKNFGGLVRRYFFKQNFTPPSLSEKGFARGLLSYVGGLSLGGWALTGAIVGATVLAGYLASYTTKTIEKMDNQIEKTKRWKSELKALAKEGENLTKEERESYRSRVISKMAEFYLEREEMLNQYRNPSLGHILLRAFSGTVRQKEQDFWLQQAEMDLLLIESLGKATSYKQALPEIQEQVRARLQSAANQQIQRTIDDLTGPIRLFNLYREQWNLEKKDRLWSEPELKNKSMAVASKLFSDFQEFAKAKITLSLSEMEGITPAQVDAVQQALDKVISSNLIIDPEKKVYKALVDYGFSAEDAQRIVEEKVRPYSRLINLRKWAKVYEANEWDFLLDTLKRGELPDEIYQMLGIPKPEIPKRKAQPPAYPFGVWKFWPKISTLGQGLVFQPPSLTQPIGVEEETQKPKPFKMLDEASVKEAMKLPFTNPVIEITKFLVDKTSDYWSKLTEWWKISRERAQVTPGTVPAEPVLKAPPIVSYFERWMEKIREWRRMVEEKMQEREPLPNWVEMEKPPIIQYFEELIERIRAWRKSIEEKMQEREPLPNWVEMEPPPIVRYWKTLLEMNAGRVQNQVEEKGLGTTIWEHLRFAPIIVPPPEVLTTTKDYLKGAFQYVGGLLGIGGEKEEAKSPQKKSNLLNRETNIERMENHVSININVPRESIDEELITKLMNSVQKYVSGLANSGRGRTIFFNSGTLSTIG